MLWALIRINPEATERVGDVYLGKGYSAIKNVSESDTQKITDHVEKLHEHSPPL